MVDQVSVTQKITFQQNMELMLQPRGGELISTCMDGDLDGVLAEIDDFFGAVPHGLSGDRHVSVQLTQGPQDRLWLAKPGAVGYYADQVNKQDQINANIDLSSGYMMQASATIKRYHTCQWLAGFFGSRQTGQKGTTTVPFPTAQVIPANYGFGASGSNHLNVAKILAAAEMLSLGDVDFDNSEVYMLITPKQRTDLLKEAQVTMSDFTSMGGRLSDDGKKVLRFAGFNFVEANLNSPLYTQFVSTTYTSPTTSQTVRKLPYWDKRGVYAGWWERAFTGMDVIPEQHYETLIYARSVMAVTRTQDGMSGFIECYEG